MTYTITPNADFNSIEISFDGKPSEAVRNALKALKFRWHRIKKVWYGYADEATARAAIDGEETESSNTTIKPAAVPSVIDLSGIENNKMTESGAAFAKTLREDLKKRGAKGVTIRASKATHTDSITATITMQPEDFRSVEEAAARAGWEKFFKMENHGVYVGGVFYHSNGTNNITCGSRWDDNSADSNAHILRQFWREQIQKFSVNEHYMDRKNYPEITDAAYNRISAIVKIIQSYNWNHSDIMTDYFDVGFFFDVDIKFPKDFTPREEMTDEERAKVYADEKAEAEAWEKYMEEKRIERERAEAEAQAHAEQEEKERTEIMAAATVEDLPENAQYYVYALAGGIGKESTIDELRERANRTEDAYITRRVTFSSQTALDKFSNMLLHDWDFVAGKGGTATNDKRVNNDNIHQLSKEQRKSVRFFANDCIAVYFGGVLQFVINPEGYNYPRYCYIPTADTVEATPEETTAAIQADDQEDRPEFYFPAPVTEQAKALNVGDTVTVYQADDMILNFINAATGSVESVERGKYAQYTGVYITVKTGRKSKTFFCTDSDIVMKTVIFPCFALPLPSWVKEKDVQHTPTARTCFVRNNDDQLRQIIAFYAQNGINPVFDTIKR